MASNSSPHRGQSAQGDAFLDIDQYPSPSSPGHGTGTIATVSSTHLTAGKTSVVRRLGDPQRSRSEADESRQSFSRENADGASPRTMAAESAPLILYGPISKKGTSERDPQNKNGAISKVQDTSHIAHLNGLRALAFIGVLLFHFRHGCQGGFLGVDVFFVLSGYLMTRSIGSQLSSGSFSYILFLRRRFWRLYPALLSTMIFTLALTYGFFSTEITIQVARSAIASTFGVSNLLFMSEEGYFGTASVMKPLLHTWSLSVEWQFYLLWPLMMAYAFRFSHLGRSVWPLSVLSILSFLHGLHIASKAPQAAFFMLPGRAFEFGIGALALTSFPTVKSEKLGNALSLSGTSLIILSFCFINSTHGAPALIALPALFGAVMVIVSPSTCRANSVYTSLAFDYLGKISYSAYLVHWPVFVFYHNVFENEEAPWQVEAIIVTLMMLGSAWMFHNVEDNFRSGKKVRHRITGMAALVFVIAASVHAIRSAGWPNRVQSSALSTTARALGHSDYLNEAKMLYLPSERKVPGMEGTFEFGVIPNSTSKCVSKRDSFDALVVGDSFAAPLAGVFNTLAREQGKTYVLASHFSCAPFLDPISTNQSIRDYPNPNNNPRANKCKGPIRAGLFGLAKGTKTKVVVLTGNWLATSQMWKAKYESVQDNPNSLKNLTDSQLQQTIVLLRGLGLKVLVIGMVPGAHYNVRACLAAKGPLAFLKKCPLTSRFSEPFQGTEYQKKQMSNRVKIRETMNALFGGESPVLHNMLMQRKVGYIDPFLAMCDSKRKICRVASGDGEPWYSDEYHLTPGGTLVLKASILKALKTLS